MLAILQINGASCCPTWDTIASKYNIDTIWLDTRTDAPNIDITIMQPQLVLVQCYVQWMRFDTIGWNTIQCPIIASCGDAACVTDVDTVYANLPYLARLHVEGADYIDIYKRKHPDQSQLDKLKYQHLCNDRMFPFVTNYKEHDWCFIGQVYPAYDERLKHDRVGIVKQLAAELPHYFVAGQGWDIHLRSAPAMPQTEVNSHYSQCHVVVSIDAHNGSGYTSTRTIEAMHGGHCTMIYEHDGADYLKRDIVDGEHAFYFKTVEEFKQKLSYIKNNPEFADRMRKNGAKLIRELGWTMRHWMESAAAYAASVMG